jgi:putative alpha-1,2-mannosidase
MRGLIDALGGDAKAIARLDPFVGQLNAGAAAPHLYIGNEPGFWAPWFYLWAHAPARAQDVVRRIVDTCFLPTPDGLPGNDDLGATSSWLVWASLGLFPAVPGVSGLAIASPEFRHIEIMAGTGRKMTIEAPAAPARYVQGLTVDGLPTSHPWLGEQRVRSGGSLAFHLTDQPSDWGSGADAVPDSFLGETAAPDRPGEPYRAGLSPSSWEPGPRTSSP